MTDTHQPIKSDRPLSPETQARVDQIKAAFEASKGSTFDYPEVDWTKYLKRLQKHHGIFQKLAKLGRPAFTKQIDTAAVGLTKDKRIMFKFNPILWNHLDDNERLFVLGHEMLHLVYGHLFYGNRDQPKRTNIAMDITVNESLRDYFGFPTTKFVEELFCFVDNTFDPQLNVKYRQTMQYYYDLLENNPKCQGDGNGSFDEHGSMTPEEFEEFAKEHFSQEDLDGIKKHIKDRNEKAGKSSGDWTDGLPVARLPKQKWETVIKNWARKFVFEKDVQQWIMPSRRHALLDPSLSMQSDMTVDNPKPERILVWFFQDHSGSCVEMAPRFRQAALSLPPNRFDVRAFSFDTEVQPIDLDSGQVYGGGGTSFSIMEEFIQNTINKEGTSYPQAVFVITDGYGDDIQPEKPDLWHVFLTEGGSTSNFPPTTNIYQLSQFE